MKEEQSDGDGEVGKGNLPQRDLVSDATATSSFTVIYGMEKLVEE